MPYIKPREQPFEQMQRLLKKWDLQALRLAEVLGCAYNTAKRKFNQPETLTLADLGKINRSGHVPIEEIRDAIVR